MAAEEVIKICTSKMKKAFEVFSHDLASLRTGRANVSMLDIIKVDVYGQMMPINQIATVSTPDPRTINVQAWDQNNVNLIDSLIKKDYIVIDSIIDRIDESTEKLINFCAPKEPINKSGGRGNFLELATKL